MHAPWCGMSGNMHHHSWHCNEKSYYDVTYEQPWHHVWCHHYVIGQAYKRCHMAPIGVHLFISVPLLRWGTHACRDWCADAPAFLEPTSSKNSWLGCYYCCEHLHCADAFTHSVSILWAPPYSCLVPSLQDLHTFSWCLCALYSLY